MACKIEEHLMSFDKYNTLKHKVPYLYSVKHREQYLYYFGSNHSRDSKNIQYEILRDFWQDFLKHANRKESVVFVEGGKREVCNTEIEAIAKGAEAHYITYLADRECIETFSPEPSEKHRFGELEKHFSKKEIAFYEFARMMLQWSRHHGEKPDFREYVGNSLKNDKTNSGWLDFDFSIEHMLEIQNQLFNRDFDENDASFYYDVTNPTATHSKINELSRFDDSNIRDTYILTKIEEYWKSGKNLFIVYGASHAVRHEPAIKYLSGK